MKTSRDIVRVVAIASCVFLLVGFSIYCFARLTFPAAVVVHLLLMFCIFLQLEISIVYGMIKSDASEVAKTVNGKTTHTLTSIEFLDSPLTFREEQLYCAITKSNLDPAVKYDAVLAFLASRVKNKNLSFGDMPAEIIPVLLEKAYTSSVACLDSSKIEFDNVENIFDDENSK